MNDKELADKIVGCGIGRHRTHLVGVGAVESVTLEAHAPPILEQYYLGIELIGGPGNFVTDWRVVGALLERTVWNLDAIVDRSQVMFLPAGDSIPRTLAAEAVKYIEAPKK